MTHSIIEIVMNAPEHLVDGRVLSPATVLRRGERLRDGLSRPGVALDTLVELILVEHGQVLLEVELVLEQHLVDVEVKAILVLATIVVVLIIVMMVMMVVIVVIAMVIIILVMLAVLMITILMSGSRLVAALHSRRSLLAQLLSVSGVCLCILRHRLRGGTTTTAVATRVRAIRAWRIAIVFRI
jgi:hypothetical protein